MQGFWRFRQFFLLSLILWGVVGGVFSIHRCLNMASSHSLAIEKSCCCDNSHASKNSFNKAPCCKTISSYVSIPFYFVVGKLFKFSLNNHSLFYRSMQVHFFNQGFAIEKFIHPPPDLNSDFDSIQNKRALRI